MFVFWPGNGRVFEKSLMNLKKKLKHRKFQMGSFMGSKFHAVFSMGWDWLKGKEPRKDGEKKLFTKLTYLFLLLIMLIIKWKEESVYSRMNGRTTLQHVFW